MTRMPTLFAQKALLVEIQRHSWTSSPACSRDPAEFGQGRYRSRRNRARAKRVSIDRSVVQMCLHIYKLHDSRCSCRSKQYVEVSLPVGRQTRTMSSFPEFCISSKIHRSQQPRGINTARGHIFEIIPPLPAGISVSRKTSIKLSRLARVPAKHPSSEPS
jgi:hypothetical protein